MARTNSIVMKGGWVEDGVGYIPLTQGQVAKIDPEDLSWLIQWNWVAHRIKTTGRFYARRTDYSDSKKHRTISLHRQILGLTDSPRPFVDHANNDSLDNRRRNLRVASHAENCRNVRRSRRNTTGRKGITFVPKRNKYQASITVDSKKKWLGYFETLDEAATVYAEAAKKHHHDFACFDEVTVHAT